MKKLQSLRYFPPAVTLTVSLAVLTVTGFWIGDFPFLHTLGPEILGRISEMGEPICTKLQNMIAQSSVQNKFISRLWKIAPLWSGGRPIGFGGKNAQNFAVFKPLWNLRGRSVWMENKSYARNRSNDTRMTKMRPASAEIWASTIKWIITLQQRNKQPFTRQLWHVVCSYGCGLQLWLVCGWVIKWFLLRDQSDLYIRRNACIFTSVVDLPVVWM